MRLVQNHHEKMVGEPAFLAINAALRHVTASVRASALASFRFLIDLYACTAKQLRSGNRLNNMLITLDMGAVDAVPAVVDEAVAMFSHLCTRVALTQAELFDKVFGSTFLPLALKNCTTRVCRAMVCALSRRIGSAAGAMPPAPPAPPAPIWHVLGAEVPLDSSAFEFLPAVLCREKALDVMQRIIVACCSRSDGAAGMALHEEAVALVQVLGATLARACSLAAGTPGTLEDAQNPVCKFFEDLRVLGPRVLAAGIGAFVAGAPAAVWGELHSGERLRVAVVPGNLVACVSARRGGAARE